MNNKGFSLVEVLISIVIFGIFMGSLVSFFISEYKQYVVHNQIIGMQNNARGTMDFVVRILRNSNSTAPVIDPEDECEHVVSLTDIDGQNHSFDLVNSVFRYKNQPYTNNITCFEVVNVGNMFLVKIKAETERKLPNTGNEAKITLESTVRPRNLR
ncbi:PilW family protein [Desulfonatronum parangueonense]